MEENIGLIKDKKTTYKGHKVNITKDKNDDGRYIVKIDGDWIATPNGLEFSKFIAEYFIDGMEHQKEIMGKEIEKLKEENEELKHKNELQEKALIKLCLKHNYSDITIGGEEVIDMSKYKIVKNEKPKEEKLF